MQTCFHNHTWRHTRNALIRYINTPIQTHWKLHQQKWIILDTKKSDTLHISAPNIDCEYSLEPPRRGCYNEYSQSMFWNRNKKNNVYPCKPQFYYIKVGFKGGQNYIGMFSRCFRRRYEEQNDKTNSIKPPTHEQRRTTNKNDGVNLLTNLTIETLNLLQWYL